MLQEIFYGLLGNWGRATIEWMLANPSIMGIVSFVWVFLWATGKYQLHRVERLTEKMLLESVNRRFQATESVGIKALYEESLPEWRALVRRTAYYIPHRWELWPLPAKPDRVQEKMAFDREWVEHFLWSQGYPIQGDRVKRPADGEKLVPTINERGR